MLNTRFYKVAGHVFAVKAEFAFDGMLENAGPFECPESDAGSSLIFELNIENREASADGTPAVEFVEETRQEDEGQRIVCGHTGAGESVYEFYLGSSLTGTLVCTPDYSSTNLLLEDSFPKFALNNSLMVLYALSTSKMGTALFHAAVVSHSGMGYLFLGKSGTGKSTHARLWLKYIDGCELINDDNPVVRIREDGIWVYGSPWSGKTPCYKNVALPLGGIVLLSQAPYNKIRRLEGVEAYAALVISISGKRWDRAMADSLHQTENALAKSARMYYLECLPDEAAARICFDAVAAKTPTDAQIMAEAIRLVQSGVCVTFPVNGRSMLPFVEGGRESVVLAKPQKVKVGDVVLAFVEGSRYVVHRVIALEGESVTLMGDGNLTGVEHCTLNDVKAIATHVVGANGRRRSMDFLPRRCAAKLWVWLCPVRKWLFLPRRVCAKLRRMFKTV